MRIKRAKKRNVKPGRKAVKTTSHTRGKRGPGDTPRVRVKSYKRRSPR